ncbi:MAG: VOC family protein [Ilumatobacteraceae bacterium]
MIPTSNNRLGGFGIAVADLDRSATFYRSVFGMVDVATFDLADMREIVLGFDGKKSAVLALMQYVDGSNNNWQGNPIKLVMHVDDAEAIATSVVEHGGRVTMPPQVFANFGGAMVGFVTDPDGHRIEIISR